MVCKIALLSNILLASATLAIPSSRLETRLARRRENCHSHPINHLKPDVPVSDALYSSNWAGAVWAQDNGTFTTVTGTFTVPTPSGNNGAASFWVGIDGESCLNAVLQTGIQVRISDGSVSYDAWYEWYPAPALNFSGITINAGDVITTTATAFNETSGSVVIENHTTEQTVTKNLSSSSPLCRGNAEWIVEDFEEDGSLVPFVNFSTVTFTNATASGPNGTYTPSGALIFNIEQNDTVLTSVSTSGDTVTIIYV